MKKICFISSTGGHLTQLNTIFNSFNKEEFCVLTENNESTISLKKKYDAYFLIQQERKNLLFPLILFVNFWLSFVYIIRIRPKLIISTGAGVVIPFCILGKLFGCKLIFIESFAKVHTPTITGRILYNFADKFFVQWEELLSFYKNSEYKGRLY